MPAVEMLGAGAAGALWFEIAESRGIDPRLDPCKVTRTALQNAASIASLILTTDCMIAQAQEKPVREAGVDEVV